MRLRKKPLKLSVEATLNLAIPSKAVKDKDMGEEDDDKEDEDEDKELKSDSELETTRFRQAVYINFARRKHIPNPCGNKQGYERIIACFIKQLMLDHNSCSATVHSYVESINTLCHLWNFNVPADLTDHSNMSYKIILAQEREENIARQRSPITREMFTALLDQAKQSSANPLEMVVAHWFILIRITGLRCAEYRQTTQSSFDEHGTGIPIGEKRHKSIRSKRLEIHNSKGQVINVHNLQGDLKEFPMKLKITFRIQKNRQNGQSITLAADNDHVNIHPVRAAYQIFHRSKRLDQSDSEPMAMFVNKFGINRYLTGSKIADILQSNAKAVYPDLSADEIKCFSSHSGKVWALVLLDEAGMTPVFMTSCLCWMGDARHR